MIQTWRCRSLHAMWWVLSQQTKNKMLYSARQPQSANVYQIMAFEEMAFQYIFSWYLFSFTDACKCDGCAMFGNTMQQHASSFLCLYFTRSSQRSHGIKPTVPLQSSRQHLYICPMQRLQHVRYMLISLHSGLCWFYHKRKPALKNASFDETCLRRCSANIHQRKFCINVISLSLINEDCSWYE